MNIGIIGFGVVGSATGKGLKQFGNEVYITDTDRKKLEENEDNFHARKDYNIRETDATFVCVPTGKYEERGSRINDFHINSVFGKLGEQLRKNEKYHVFVVRSTVLPGMTRELGRELEDISGKKLGEDFGLAMNPEFLRAFNNEQDFVNPKATIIGGYDERSRETVAKAYKAIEKTINFRALEEAEEIKFLNNNYNAAKISFGNEVFLIAAHLGIEAEQLRQKIVQKSSGIRYSKYGTFPRNPVNGSSLERTLDLHTFLKNNGFNSETLRATLSVKKPKSYRKDKETVNFSNTEKFSYYLANAFNNYKSAFLIERNRICNILGIDFDNVRDSVVLTAEGFWNPQYGTYGGLPFGGTCLPKDAAFYETFLAEKGIYAPVLEAVINVNETMIAKGFDKRTLDELNEYHKKRFHPTYNNIVAAEKVKV